MKHLTLTLLSTIITVLGNSQVPDYFANSPLWHCKAFMNGEIHDYVYYLDDTITIDNNLYQLINYRGEYYPEFTPSDINYYDNFAAYLRQDGKSIRYYDTVDSIDSLLVNYSLTVGDSLKHNYYEVYSPFDTLVVQKIDSVLVDSEYRKIFQFDTLNTNLQLIEGIGFQFNQINGGFIGEITEHIGTTEQLICYGKDYTAYWLADSSANDCDLTKGILGNNPISKLNVAIYPNPTKTGLINIKHENLTDLNYTVFNTAGEIIKVGKLKSDQLHITNKPGIYFLHLNSAEGNVVKKIVVQ